MRVWCACVDGLQIPCDLLLTGVWFCLPKVATLMYFMPFSV